MNEGRKEVAPAEIRTCNLPIVNPALYHTATIAPLGFPFPKIILWLIFGHGDKRPGDLDL